MATRYWGVVIAIYIALHTNMSMCRGKALQEYFYGCKWAWEKGTLILRSVAAKKEKGGGAFTDLDSPEGTSVLRRIMKAKPTIYTLLVEEEEAVVFPPTSISLILTPSHDYRTSTVIDAITSTRAFERNRL